MTIPLWAVVSERRRVVEPISLGDVVAHYSIPNVDTSGEAVVEVAGDIRSAKLHVRAGDVLVSRLNPRKPRVVLVDRHAEPAVASTEFIPLVPKRVEHRFLRYFLSSQATASWLDARAQSVTRSHQRVEADVVLRLLLPDMQGAEQCRIADFLDDQVARLDAAAEEARKLSLLTGEAAARRLEVLVGAHAHTSVALGRVLQQTPSYGVLKPESSDEPGAVPLVRIMDVDDRGRVDLDGAMKISREQSIEYSRTRLRRGDVILSVVGTLGRAAVVDDSLEGANISRALCRLVLKPSIEPALIQAQFRTQSFRRFCDDVTRATAQAVLNMGDLTRFQVLAPDVLNDSARLLEAFSAVETWRHAAEDNSARLLRVLEERKRALITACVTGEFDVATASDRAADPALAGRA